MRLGLSFVVIFTGFFVGLLADAKVCDRLFSDSFKSRKFIKKIDLEKVDALLLAKTENGKIPYREIFNVYLQARLQSVSSQWRNAVVHELPWIFYNNKKHQASAAGIYLPPQFDGTAIPFFILAHEVEHIIQRYELSNDEPSKLLGLLAKRYLGVFETHRLEGGAMEAEWEFLSLIPKAELHRALHISLTTKLTAKPIQALVTRSLALTIQEKESEAFVQAHREAGRYSYAENAMYAGLHWSRIIFAGCVLYGVIQLF